ncbi:MAG: D-alanyl-D-alanine carboxypeptidase [Ruminococcaceae bacterium]|nr:D-alanyl-D-alanine carboxypeptidase [Oscillospiraceae bacterium]
MKKRIFLRLFGFFVTLVMLSHTATLFCRAQISLSVSAKSAVLIDADSGKVLYEHAARTRMGMASTTKIMTALTVTRIVSLTDTVSIPREAVGTEGSSVYLCEGEKLTVEQLLYALLLSSANDAAVALAVYCSGSVEAFAEQMNLYARELGLSDTNFVNPHGLYDEMHYTTAYDLALITRAALEVECIRRIVSTYKITLPFEGVPDRRLAVNHNKLLKTYDGAIGVKTGFTKKTGRCLVSAAERDGLTLIAVTLSAPDDWRDHTAMLDHGFENYERRIIADVGELCVNMPVTGGNSDNVTLRNTAPLALTLPKAQLSPDVRVYSTYPFLYAPVREGERFAYAETAFEGEICSSPMEIGETVERRESKRGFFHSIINFFKKD